MYHRNYTTYLQRELDFLKLLVTRFHDQEKVNGLELDVALMKTQEIYEQLLRMKLMPESEHQPELSEAKQPKPQPQPVASEPEPQSVAIEEKPIPAEVLESESVMIVKEEPVPPVCRTKEHPTVVEPARNEILAEKISPTDFHPINETLAQQKYRNDLSTKLQTAPISSIASGIGLNDKFLYMRELFKGDSAMYSNTIQQLDTASSLSDAMDFINRHFDWDKKNETVQKFIHLVQRRHH